MQTTTTRLSRRRRMIAGWLLVACAAWPFATAADRARDGGADPAPVTAVVSAPDPGLPMCGLCWT